MPELIVLSADALVYEDIEYLSTLPNFRKYLAGGVGVKKVKSVYPTITYPCHTTMSTGVYPDRHGVPGNFEFTPGRTKDLPWLWDYKYNLYREDIFTAAKAAGLHTAAVFWPVTGNHPCIDDLIDEYWVQGPEDRPREAFARMGSDEHMLDIIERNLHGRTDRPPHPDQDAFIVNCACDVIRECQPDLLFLHPADVDWARHEYGVFNDQVRRTVENTDRYIGLLMETVAESADPEKTNLVLVSDHGQRNIRRIVNLNLLLARNGLIRTDADGNFLDWDAWIMSGGMSANVYLKHPEDKKTEQKVYDLLRHACEDELSEYGIIRVLTREEFKAEHLDGPFSFVLESDWDVSFSDGYREPLTRDFAPADYRYGRATHGYLPDKGPQPTFWAKGPGFKQNVILENADLVDEAPTFAKLLGLTLSDTDGRSLDELLR